MDTIHSLCSACLKMHLEIALTTKHEEKRYLEMPSINSTTKNSSKLNDCQQMLNDTHTDEDEKEAQDEVIGVLKAEKINLALLEAQYGFVTPKKVLEALQRDAIQAKATLWQEDIYEKPMGELDKVMEKHKESHRRMLEQLLMVEKSHRQTLYDLEDEKRKHAEYMEKSDEFTNLLEQEQESSVHGMDDVAITFMLLDLLHLLLHLQKAVMWVKGMTEFLLVE
ncbi:hypothetical protein JD844_032990 [Phrynosoma platyrhinos]|uniref:Cortactin-binding protein-2 N-terminal domain-containing protein n=1 Tax=Phrynosoma platyrhinos TaxID=52577 RepID=A0ABQ7T5I0_PHRPL|nr:hypothetical protein JD844_032990 [Phrynosoma platyrhinos]